MSDQLENKIKEKVEELDQIERLDADLMWDDFQRKRKATKVKSIPLITDRRWYALAASFLLIAACILYNKSENKNYKNLIVNNLEEMDASLAQYQNSLFSDIDTYSSTLSAMGVETYDYPDIAESLDQVERLAKSYQDDIKKYGPDPKIIKAILKCTKQKVRLYEMLLHQIEIKNYHENKNAQFNI